MKTLIINEYEKNNKDFNSAVNQINNAVSHILQNDISDEEISGVKDSINMIKSVLNNESINSMNDRDFLKTWVSEFMVY